MKALIVVACLFCMAGVLYAADTLDITREGRYIVHDERGPVDGYISRHNEILEAAEAAGEWSSENGGAEPFITGPSWRVRSSPPEDTQALRDRISQLEDLLASASSGEGFEPTDTGWWSERSTLPLHAPEGSLGAPVLTGTRVPGRYDGPGPGPSMVACAARLGPGQRVAVQSWYVDDGVALAGPTWLSEQDLESLSTPSGHYVLTSASLDNLPNGVHLIQFWVVGPGELLNGVTRKVQVRILIRRSEPA